MNNNTGTSHKQAGVFRILRGLFLLALLSGLYGVWMVNSAQACDGSCFPVPTGDGPPPAPPPTPPTDDNNDDDCDKQSSSEEDSECTGPDEPPPDDPLPQDPDPNDNGDEDQDPPLPEKPEDKDCSGDPISPVSGKWYYRHEDLVLRGLYSIRMVRRYDSQTRYDSPLGYGWAFTYDKRLYKYPDGSVIIRRDCGVRDKYLYTGGAYQSPAGNFNVLTEEADGSFNLSKTSGVTEHYNPDGTLAYLENSLGHRLEMSYDSRGRLPLKGSSPFAMDPATPTTVAYDYRLTRVAERRADGSLSGRYVDILYDEATGRVDKIQSSDGRVMDYSHDLSDSPGHGNLIQVDGLEGITAVYDYNDIDDLGVLQDPHNLTAMQEWSGAATLQLTYNPIDQVIRQVRGTDQYDYVYDLDTVVTHTIKDSTGTVLDTMLVTYTYNEQGFMTEIEEQLADRSYRRVRVRDGAQNVTQFKYYEKIGTAKEDLVKQVDYTYDNAGNLLSEVTELASGEQIVKNWEYDHNKVSAKQVASTLAPFQVFRTEFVFDHNSAGWPTTTREVRRRLGVLGDVLTTSYRYDALGRLVSKIYPDGHVVQYDYSGDFVSRIYHDNGTGGDALFLAVDYGYDAQGNRNSVTDANGRLTEAVYDDLGRIVQVTNALGEETHFSYTNEDLSELELGRTAADGAGQVVRLSYTPEGWLSQVDRQRDGGSWLTSLRYTYDSRGKAIAISDGLNRTNGYDYDALGRLLSRTDALGNTTQYQYDGLGNRSAVIDASGRETRFTYDVLNRLTETEQLGVSPGAVTRLAYDAMGNLTALTDANGQTTRYDYDSLSRNTRVTQPLGETMDYRYDARGRLAELSNSRGQRIAYGYYDWGLLSAIDVYASADASEPTRSEAYSYTLSGALQIINSDGLIQLNLYDALDRVSNAYSLGLGGQSHQLSYGYDRYGNRASLSYLYLDPASSQWVTRAGYTYSHDRLNRLTAATLLNPAPYGFDYDDADELTQTRHPNGQTTDYGYYANGPVQQIRLSGSAGLLDQRDYGYTPDRQIASLQTLAGQHDYSYDGLNRLIQALHPTATGLPAEEAFAYDPAGNREDPLDDSLYAYDANNRIQQSPEATYQFDDDGNLITRQQGSQVEQLGYDEHNRLVSYTDGATTAGYGYDPQGRRIEKTVDGLSTYYLWDGTRLLAELDAGGNVRTQYAYLPGQRVPAEMQDANGVYEVHSDHLQTPALLTDENQSVVWSAVHEAYGNAIVNQDPDGNGTDVTFNVRFPGQYYDQETGLHYNFFRYYDPNTGRYITQDPIGQAGGVNLYAYVEGDPVGLMDPLGLIKEGPGKTGNPIEGPYRPPPSTTEKVVNKIAEQIAKQIGKQFGIPPQFIGRSPGLFGGVGLFFTPSELGCGSFDCDNNGTPDEQESGGTDGANDKGCR